MRATQPKRECLRRIETQAVDANVGDRLRFNVTSFVLVTATTTLTHFLDRSLVRELDLSPQLCPRHRLADNRISKNLETQTLRLAVQRPNLFRGKNLALGIVQETSRQDLTGHVDHLTDISPITLDREATVIVGTVFDLEDHVADFLDPSERHTLASDVASPIVAVTGLVDLEDRRAVVSTRTTDNPKIAKGKDILFGVVDQQLGSLSVTATWHCLVEKPARRFLYRLVVFVPFVIPGTVQIFVPILRRLGMLRGGATAQRLTIRGMDRVNHDRVVTTKQCRRLRTSLDRRTMLIHELVMGRAGELTPVGIEEFLDREFRQISNLRSASKRLTNFAGPLFLRLDKRAQLRRQLAAGVRRMRSSQVCHMRTSYELRSGIPLPALLAALCLCLRLRLRHYRISCLPDYVVNQFTTARSLLDPVPNVKQLSGHFSDILHHGLSISNLVNLAVTVGTYQHAFRKLHFYRGPSLCLGDSKVFFSRVAVMEIVDYRIVLQPTNGTHAT